MISSSIYVDLLKLYQQMTTIQNDLANQLKAHNQQGAEKDIIALQSLVTDMSLEGHEAHFPEGPIAIDTIGMEKYLNAMSGDVQNGNFAGAQTADESFQVYLFDAFHRIA